VKVRDGAPVRDGPGGEDKALDRKDRPGFSQPARTRAQNSQDKLAATIPPGSPTFNQFVRLNADKTFSVWLFPAFQRDRLAVYGGEGVYTIDAAGKKIVKDESYFQVAFRGLKTEPPREVWLDYSEMDKPSLGAIFFVWYYKSYFTKIFIDNEKTTSTVAKTGNQYVWIHVVKDEEK
jgi:hypothetical protein